MEEEEVLCRFGTPLEPLEEDEVPSKKPILIEDQIVTDENGRRRFHGAFTGGFSAGFWNTVGSLEGWTPKEFKSSRDEKFKIQQQKPTDFMDDEDFGEFGFAPQRVQTTADFTSKKDGNEENSKKRKHNKNNDGPIPGIPVLQQLLEPSKENVAIRLLKKMGWKEGQGIGARQTKIEKKLSAKHNLKEQYILKKYGCDMGPMSKADSVKSDSDSESDISDIGDITFAPDDFEPYVCAAKDNCFGLGYVGLSRDPVLKQHINLFGPLEVLDNKKQKLSIRGKGFGVGALEEEDEDIYHHDDISNYDFSLDKPSNQKNKPKPKPQDFHIIDGFSERNETTIHTKKVFIVKIPPNFNPRNWLIRKSRFEPLDEKRAAIIKQQEEVKIKGLGRHDITLDERKEILEGTSQKSIDAPTNDNNSAAENDKGNKRKQTYLEKINKKYKIEDNKKDKVLSMLAAKSDNFVKSEVIKEDGTIQKEENSTNILSEDIQKENEKIINEAKKITKNIDTNSSGIFKPFLADSAKQERYEKYLSKKFSSDEEITIFLSSIQPPNMSEWERKMEKREFQQAEKIYKPLKGIMSDRFVTESAATEEREIKKTDPNRKGKTIRTKIIWYPTSILCKRFNIAEPFVNLIKEENKTIQKPKLSVFDYLEASVNNKETFVTPIVIPHNEEIKISSPLNAQSENSKRLSAKEMFTNEVNANKNLKVENKKVESIEIKEETAEEVKNIPLPKEQKSDKIDRKVIAKEKPKTELELKIEELKNKHPSEKKDLYKTVFVSSSDSEDDEDKKIEISSENTVKISNQINEPQEISNTKDLNVVFNRPASEVNILRNNSPPRGIFAAFFKDTETPNKTQGFEIAQSDIKTESQNSLKDAVSGTKIIFKSQNERNSKVSSLNNLSSSDIYGPMMPNSINSSFHATTKLKNANTEVELNIDSKLQNLLGKHKTKTKIVEEWVEVGSSSSTKKNKKDKKKKKKKEKSKYKKRSSSTSSSSTSSSNSSSSSSNVNHSHRSKKKSKKSKKSKKHRK